MSKQHEVASGGSGLSRRRFLGWTLAAGLGGAVTVACGAGYVLAVEPGWLAVERIEVPVPDLPPALEGLAVAHLSDLHWGPYTGQREIRAAVQAANDLAPDLILLTGDYVFHHPEYAAPCARELACLWAPLGVVAVAGNHDHWAGIEVVAAQLDLAGVMLLRNESRRLEVSGQPLFLAGVDDVMERRDDLDATLAGVPGDEPVLLLVHEPDVADRVADMPHRILLQLSGHSHGGQINLPLLGPPVLPWLAENYPAGLQSVPGSRLQVYTSRGIGVIAPPVRFNCRPEVALLTLVRSP